MPLLNPDYSNLDYDALAGEIGLKPKHIPMLIGSFLEESVSILEKLENAIASKEFAEVKLHAHSIKGSAGNLKFHEIYEMAKDMELAAASGDDTFDYRSYFNAIETAIQTIEN